MAFFRAAIALVIPSYISVHNSQKILHRTVVWPRISLCTGTICTEGIIKGNEKGGFVCMDETARKMLPYNKEYELKEGKYPGGTQEIAAGRAFFSEMGYDDVKVGDTVTLDYRAGMQSEYKPEEFVVSGILYDRDEYTIF